MMSAQRDLNRHLRFRIGTCRNIPNCRLINEILQTPQVPHWNLSEHPHCRLINEILQTPQVPHWNLSEHPQLSPDQRDLTDTSGSALEPVGTSPLQFVTCISG